MIKKILLLSLFSLLLNYFNLQAQNWMQIGQDFIGEETSSNLGIAVDLSDDGSVLAFGIPYAQDNGITPGFVRIYKNQNGNWIKIGQDIVGENINDLFGFSVSLNSDGSVIAIGGIKNDAGGVEVGHVRVYKNLNNNWVQVGQDIDGENTGDNFGLSVSLSADGSIVAIGGPYNSDVAANVGHVRIYRNQNDSWVQVGQDIDGGINDWLFGFSVSLSSDGSVVAIGAPYNNEGNFSGITRIYENQNDSWILTGGITGENQNDLFGYSVSLSADASRVAIGAIYNGADAGHVRVFENQMGNWIQLGQDIDGETAGDHSAYSVSLSGNGTRVAIGAPYNDGGGIDAGHARIFEYQYTDWIQIGQDIDGSLDNERLGFPLTLNYDGTILAAGAPFANDFQLGAGKVQVYTDRGVSGGFYIDINTNCNQDSLEIGLQGRKAYINPGNIIVESNNNGTWYANLPQGDYTITADTSGNWLATCPVTQSFSVVDSSQSTSAPSFGFISTDPCAYPDISVYMPFMRPCFSDQKIYVNAQNTNLGTGTITDAYVELELDPLITPTIASIPFTNIGENLYLFEIGTLNPGMTGSFWINADVSCEAVIGQTLCMEANLLPAADCVFDTIPTPGGGGVELCDLPWDNSSLEVDGWCENDSVFFSVTNTGDFGNGDMQCWSAVRLYIDGEYVLLDSVMLTGGETIIFSWSGDGRTWRLEADQHPLHPGNSHPNATVENCGNPDNWTPGLVTILPQNDADPVVDIYCGIVSSSYDPNDKACSPKGVDEQNYIQPNVKMDYTIRFQNTGTDTAFTVVIRDTLDADLNIFTVHPGVSSHDYTFRIYGERILEWTFNNILLPDSNVNEAESHGFVSYTVNQTHDLSDGTLINNNAGIYFDFNSPVVTNTTSHIVNREAFVLDIQELKKANNLGITVYPNPTNGNFTLNFVKVSNFEKVVVLITDITGKEIINTQYSIKNNQVRLNLSNQPTGIYIVKILTEKGIYSAKLIKE